MSDIVVLETAINSCIFDVRSGVYGGIGRRTRGILVVKYHRFVLSYSDNPDKLRQTKLHRDSDKFHTKYIDIRHHYITETLDCGTVILAYVSTDERIAE